MRAVRLATGWTLLLSLLISFPETTLAQAAAVCGVAKLSFDVPLVVLGGVKTPVRFSLLAGGFPANTSLILEILATYTTPDGNSAPAATGSLEVVVDSGGILDMSDQLHMTSKKSLSEFDLALLVRAGVNGTVVATAPARPVRVIPAFLSILPALLIVTMAVWSRNVVLALLAGLTLGGIFISPGFNPVAGLMRAGDTFIYSGVKDVRDCLFNPVAGLMRAGDTFLYSGVKDADMGLILFTWFMSGLVGLITKNGGALGLGRRFGSYATSARRAQGATCAAGLLIFFDDYASILIVGSTLRPVTDATGVSREKLSYITDTTAAPVASVAILSTWVGFKLSVAL
ncbi:hypothetical protein T484DRAFT_1765742 [Baffinella frigidus]|nr:hypothetical protein T484DRAFT_1765742 [Cryptophyta sp. CCMP2293]